MIRNGQTDETVNAKKRKCPTDHKKEHTADHHKKESLKRKFSEEEKLMRKRIQSDITKLFEEGMDASRLDTLSSNEALDECFEEAKNRICPALQRYLDLYKIEYDFPGEYDPPEVSVSPINAQHISEDFQLSMIDEIVTRKTIRGLIRESAESCSHYGCCSGGLCEQ